MIWVSQLTHGNSAIQCAKFEGAVNQQCQKSTKVVSVVFFIIAYNFSNSCNNNRDLDYMMTSSILNHGV